MTTDDEQRNKFKKMINLIEESKELAEELGEDLISDSFENIIRDQLETETIIRLLLKHDVQNWGVGKQLVINIVHEAIQKSRENCLNEELNFLNNLNYEVKSVLYAQIGFRIKKLKEKKEGLQHGK